MSSKLYVLDPQLPMYHIEQNRHFPQQTQQIYRGPPMHSNPNFGNRGIPQGFNPNPYNFNLRNNLVLPHEPYRMQPYQHAIHKFSEYKIDHRDISPRRSYADSVHYVPVPHKVINYVYLS